jgi:hypothetical protein
MAISAPRLAAGITRGLFGQEMPRLYAELCAYAHTPVEIDPARLARPALAAE